MQEAARSGAAGMADRTRGASIEVDGERRRLRSLVDASTIALAVAVGVAYAITARVSLLFVIEPQNITGIWPPAGIAAGALLVTAPRRWPAILAGVAVAVATANLIAGTAPGMTAGFVLANTAEPLIAAAALRRARFVSLASVRGVELFFVFGVLGAPALAAVIGAASAAVGSGAPFVATWLTWMLSDAGGVMTVAPLILAASVVGRPTTLPPLRVLEASALAGAILAITILSFFPIVSGIHLAAYPVFLLLVAAGVRFGILGAALATFTVATLAMAGTVAGSGPIAILNAGFAIQLGQAHILAAVAFLTSTVTAAAMAERRAAAEALAAQMGTEADRASRNERITAFAREIARSLEVERLFQHIVKSAAEVVPADVVQLTVASTDGGPHTVVAAIGAPDIIGRVIEPGDGVAGAVIRDGAPITARTHDASERAAAMSDVMPQQPMTITCAPIISDGIVVGTLGLGRMADGSFLPDEVRAVALMSDLGALALANSLEFGRVHDRSIRDALTGVPNRRYFDLSLEQLSAQRIRQPDGTRQDVSAIIFDLDHFGAVNKERGHGTGDRVLAGFGGILAARLRRADIVARYGGEEFVAVLVGTDRAGALHVAEDVRRAFAESSFVGDDGEPIRCTVSAGVATVGADEASVDGLVATADVALSMAKRAGRNQVAAA